ncbi:MAG: alpha/beta hydrolase [Bacteroidia bacterium]|nr:alpha/beta hydrolase [Bacteroidia bacterium]
MKKNIVSVGVAFFLILSVSAVSCKSDEEKPVDNPPVNTNQSVDTAFTTTLTFASLDDLEITADQYHIDSTKPVVILCHQAGSSRGEYKDIAPQLNSLGFNCIALDQRSGDASQGVNNETALRAQKEGKGQTFLDAEQDIIAAVDFFSKAYGKNVILWGSSYSSSLVLKIAGSNTKVERVLSFSPGEYLQGVSVADEAKKVSVPAFLTSSRSEQGQTKAIFDNVSSTEKTQFVPNGAGRHGSSALWPTEADNAEYWDAVKVFLGV